MMFRAHNYEEKHNLQGPRAAFNQQQGLSLKAAAANNKLQLTNYRELCLNQHSNEEEMQGND